ncbi:MAG: hypothetical protein AAB221_03125 [Bacteroidota bacterium]
MKGKKNERTINRRKFVGNTIKIVALGSLLAPLGQACNNKKKSGPGDTGHGKDKGKGKTSGNSSKKPRKKWSHESFVMNTKTNVLHYPTAALYTYYDEIKPNHLQEVNRNAWNPQAENAPKLNREQSGNIMEILTLQGLAKDINDANLVVAIDTLSVAFSEKYEKANSMNFRLHELMLQLVALNNAIPADQKWMTFNAKVKKPVQLRKRQQWMASEPNFNERVNYITQRRNDYISRLNKRADRYS